MTEKDEIVEMFGTDRFSKEELDEIIHSDHETIKYLEGMVEGLKFAIRCNGISGAEVK